MSDTTTSGENAPVAPAGTVGATPAHPPAATSEQAAPATTAPVFGSSRGSGLARGKRASNNATNASQNASTGEYKPTAIQVVATAREYKNPFAPAAEPAAPEAATQPAPAPESNQPAASAEPVTKVDGLPAPDLETEPLPPQAPATPAIEETPLPSPAEISGQPGAKAELNILPPEDKPRHAQSWESDSFPAEQRHQQRQERPTFQPRGQNQGDRHQRRDNRDQRDDRDGRPVDVAQTPAQAPEKKQSKGFFGWLKGLFGGSDDTPEKKPEGDRDDRRNRGGERRHRGARNRGYRGGENRDGANPHGEGHSHGQGERRFDRGDRNHRRHRGGRNRHRGDRGNGGHSGGGENAQ